MGFQLTRGSESGSATVKGTKVRFFAGVGALVCNEITGQSEHCTACIAVVWPFLRMRAFVASQCARMCETLGASRKITSVGFLAGVDASVRGETSCVRKHRSAVTIIAGDDHQLRMGTLVRRKIRRLRKRLSTATDITGEGLFAGVRPLMGLQVVLSAECALAPLEVARVDFLGLLPGVLC